MLIVNDNDYLQVNLNSLIADYDRLIITNLYMPIIGYKAVSLYFTFLSEAENQKINPITSHKNLFSRMQINASDFVDSRKLLEGIGLLKTYVSSLKSNKLYVYEIYAPKTPTLFFNNVLLYGMLIKSLGESEANKLRNLYLLDHEIEGEEITSSFMDVFTCNFDDPIFKLAENGHQNIISRTSAKLISGFSYELFVNYLKANSQINPDLFSKKDMKEIERLASLYGISEENAAQAVIEKYNPYAPKNQRIDFKELAKIFMDETHYNFLRKETNYYRVDGKISSNSDLAKKINMMETYAPKDYLTALQNGTIPAYADLALLNDLSAKYKLSNAVINALVDYVLAVNNNVLTRVFAEKIAASLAREGVQTTIDAMNYLKKTSKRGKKKIDKKEIDDSEEKINDKVDEEDDKYNLDWDQLIKELEEGNNHGED